MLAFDQAEKIVRGITPTSETERVELADSLQSILAENVTADMNMPPFNKSAVDGFACRRTDLEHPLQCKETIAAGNSPKLTVTEGTCSRIMTGAEVPKGADCVIMLEDTQTNNQGNIIFIATKTSSNICNFAEDVRKGEILLKAGTLIKSRHIPVLASMGYTQPLVYIKPSVGIISTGSELVDPSKAPPRGKIRNSNGPQLQAQCSELGIISENYGIINDLREDLKKAISLSVSKHKLSLVSGGVSVGDFDYAPDIIKELGFTIHFHGLNVKPGKRILFASKNNHYIFGLPGNPVSVLIQFEMLVRPLLLKMQNYTVALEMEKRILESGYNVKNSARLSFVPVIINPDGSVKPVEYHGSAHIFAFSSANGFMKIPEGITKFEKGELVDVRHI